MDGWFRTIDLTDVWRAFCTNKITVKEFAVEIKQRMIQLADYEYDKELQFCVKQIMNVKDKQQFTFAFNLLSNWGDVIIYRDANNNPVRKCFLKIM